MLFNSIAFLLFFPLVCIIYFCIPRKSIRVRNLFLLFASYYFYMNWEPAYALLIFTSTILTYLAAIGINHWNEKWKRKTCLLASILLNLSILFLFKYYNFLATNVTAFLFTFGCRVEMPVFRYLLPVGISFYTFQALGYSIDVYRGVTKVERDFPTYALFVSFFPQLVAGPIERSNNLLPQFHECHNFNYKKLIRGLKLMVWGYFMKLVIADRCAMYVDAVFNNVDKHNGISYAVASFLFTFQIYGDFAGYSLIAIGVAMIMGFNLMTNFRQPYLAYSIGDFWHRWHISLSTWFKDYVYIPLGGNRVSRLHQYLNLMLTFIVSGIWHGANWTFFGWGTFHGLLLCAEKKLGIRADKSSRWTIMLFSKQFVTFILVCFAWILFRANTIADAITIYTGIFTKHGELFMDYITFISLGCFLPILLIKDIAHEYSWHVHISDTKYWIVSHLYISIMIAIIVLFGVLDNNQFIYFQF